MHFPSSHHHVTEGLFTAVYLTWYIVFGYPGNIQGILKVKQNKTQTSEFKETEQASEPDMGEMLKLSDWEFKTTG